MKHYFVYILSNKLDTVFYTGVTNNLDRRTREHRSKFIQGFTKKYNIEKLVFFESFLDPTEAINAEKKIKGWTRIKKIKLIESKNPRWLDLFETLEMYNATRGIGKLKVKK